MHIIVVDIPSKCRFRDMYGVEVAPDQEDVLILAVTVALDQMAHN